MRHLLLAVVGVLLLFGQSPGPNGLTGAVATSAALPGQPTSAGASHEESNRIGQERRGIQSAVVVGAAVASVAAADAGFATNK